MYEDRVLAFIDVLGFSNMVAGTMNSGIEDEGATRKIRDFFENAQKQLCKADPKYADFKKSRVVNHFSDTIVISYLKTEGGGVFQLLSDILFLCVTALQRHCSLRGAIVCDKLYHEKEIIFGPAMVKAHKMEQSLAIFPRIVLDDDILCIANKYPAEYPSKSEQSKTIKRMVKKDFDGLHYVDCLDTMNFIVGGGERTWVPDYFKLSHKIINDLEKRIKNDMGIKSKYLWLKEKYNADLGAYKKRYCNDRGKIKSAKLYKYLQDIELL